MLTPTTASMLQRLPSHNHPSQQPVVRKPTTAVPQQQLRTPQPTAAPEANSIEVLFQVRHTFFHYFHQVTTD